MQPDLTPIIDEIRAWHRQRCYAMECRKVADLRLGAHLRIELGWSKDLPQTERDKIKNQAIGLIALGEKIVDGKATGAGDAVFAKFSTIIVSSINSRALWDEIEVNAKKEMERLAKLLPVWVAWGEGVRGFGAVSLAVIVGEAGDLSKYPKKSHLWKRMGLAVIDGVRQGGLRKGASAEAWKAQKYSPPRRSRMWNVGDTMLKAQVRKIKDEAGEDTGERTSLGEYGATYLARKAYVLARNPDMTPMHAHRDSQRIMEKRLLLNLWQAWRRAISCTSEKARKSMPVSELTEGSR